MGNVLLGIWLGSAAANLIISPVYGKAFINRAKRDGYDWYGKNCSFSERIVGTLRSLFWSFVPIVNTISAVYLLSKGMSDDMYKNLLFKCIVSGDLKKVNNDDVVINVSSTTKEDSSSKDISYSKNCVSYDDMSIQEKLRFIENERNNALKELDELMQDRGFSRNKKL